MKLYSVDEILIPPNRQRRQFDPEKMTDLMTDITTRGLFHAIVIRESADGPTLVSGERRLRAITQLHEFSLPFRHNNVPVAPGRVPTVTLGELNPLDALEAELSENIHREDLSWQDRCAAEVQLHALRSEQAAARGEAQPVAATARELDDSEAWARQRLTKSIRVASALADPEVAKAKTLDEAVKIVERRAVAAHRVRLAEELGPTLKSSRHQLILGNYLDVNVPGFGTFDVVITDPPYGVGADSFGEQGSKERDYVDVIDFPALAKFIAAAAAPAAHAYVFCAFERFSILETEMLFAGWSVWPRPLIWSKGNGVLPVPDGGPRYTYECILFARRGGRKTLQVGNDVLQYSSPASTGHPDQKPVELYVDLLRRSCLPGDKVLDPFAGSGTAFPAANRLMLSATGIELSPQYYAVAAGRVEGQE